ATRTVQVPGSPAAALGDGSLRIVPGSVTPGSAMTGVRGERIEVSFRGSPGGVARLVLPDGRSIPLVERAAIERTSGFMLNRTETSTGVSEYVGTLELTTDLLGTD